MADISVTDAWLWAAKGAGAVAGSAIFAGLYPAAG